MHGSSDQSGIWRNYLSWPEVWAYMYTPNYLSLSEIQLELGVCFSLNAKRKNQLVPPRSAIKKNQTGDNSSE